MTAPDDHSFEFALCCLPRHQTYTAHLEMRFSVYPLLLLPPTESTIAYCPLPRQARTLPGRADAARQHAVWVACRHADSPKAWSEHKPTGLGCPQHSEFRQYVALPAINMANVTRSPPSTPRPEYKMLKYLPSTLSASAVYLALKTSGHTPWVRAELCSLTLSRRPSVSLPPPGLSFCPCPSLLPPVESSARRARCGAGVADCGAPEAFDVH